MVRRRLSLLVLALVACAPLPGGVTTAHAAASLTQLWHYSYTASPKAVGPGWGPQPYAGTAAGDLFGDGRMEVVTAFPDGKVWAFDSSGNVLPGWPRQTGGAVFGTPAIADLFGDGKQEVIAASEDGYVYAWDANGNLLPGWPQCGCYGSQVGFQNFFIGGAVVGDLFGNGQEEIVAAGGYYVYAWDVAGHMLSGFPVFMWDSDVATPTLVDLDHNGLLWIIEGGDSIPGAKEGAWYAVPPYGCPYPNATRAGCDHAGWPITVDDTPWSSPAGVNAFETDGGGYRVYAGTGHFFHQSIPCPPCGERLDAWNPNGQSVTGWPVATGAPNFGSVAVGDLGLNNNMEQVAAQSENYDTYVLNANGTAVPGFGITGTVDLGSPAIGPVTGASGNGVWVSNFGNVLGYDGSGTLRDQAVTSGTTYATPTIADLGSGPVLLVTSTPNFSTWTVAAYAIPSPGSGNVSRSWPTFHGNMQRNGGQVPVAAITSPANGSTALTSDFDVSWAVGSYSLPATRYVLWSRDVTAGDIWRIYTRTTAQTAHFYATAGHQYAFFIDAENSLGSANLPKVGGNIDLVTAGSVASRGATYTPMTPYRILDTRAPYCVQCGSGHLNPYETRTPIQVAAYSPPGYSGPTVPGSATAAVLNVTAVSPTGSTYLSVFPTGTPRPNASSLNAPVYGQIANLVTVALGSGGDIDIFNNNATVDIVVDVEGYYSNSASTSGEYHSLAAPVRACDTRGGYGTSCNSGADNPVGAYGVRAVTLTGGTTGIPTDGTVAAVAMNLTGIVGTANTFLTVFPPDPVSHVCGTAPVASNLNLPAYSTQPNRVIMPVDPTTGQVCVFNAAGAINIAVDVNGWYGNGSEVALASGTTFHPLSPQRFCDTRLGPGTTCGGLTMGDWGVLRVVADGEGGLPGWGMKAVVINATIVTSQQSTYLTVYPDGASYPGTSDLNAGPSLSVVANLVMVTVPGDGEIDVVNAARSTDFIADAGGWFS